MRKTTISKILVLSLLAATSVFAADTKPPQIPASVKTEMAQYRVGAGDILQITVWREAEASVPNVVVRSDGRITLPLAKELDVAGLTPTEIEKAITERLANVIKDADVSVVVKETKSQRVFLAGAVRHEGV